MNNPGKVDETVEVSCKKCSTLLTKLPNRWWKVTRTHSTFLNSAGNPGEPSTGLLDFQLPTIQTEIGEYKGTNGLSGCVLRKLTCCKCNKSLGIRCIRTPYEKAIHRDKCYFIDSRISLKSVMSGETVYLNIEQSAVTPSVERSETDSTIQVDAPRKRIFESMDRETVPERPAKRRASKQASMEAPKSPDPGPTNQDLLRTLLQLEERVKQMETRREVDSERIISAVEVLQRDVSAIKVSITTRDFRGSPAVQSPIEAGDERTRGGQKRRSIDDDDIMGQRLPHRAATRLNKIRNNGPSELEVALERLRADGNSTKSSLGSLQNSIVAENGRIASNLEGFQDNIEVDTVPSSVPYAEDNEQLPEASKKMVELVDGSLEATRGYPEASTVIIRDIPGASNMITKGSSSNVVAGGTNRKLSKIIRDTLGNKKTNIGPTPSASIDDSLETQKYLEKVVVDDPNDMDYIPTDTSTSVMTSNIPADSTNEDTARSMIAPEGTLASLSDLSRPRYSARTLSTEYGTPETTSRFEKSVTVDFTTRTRQISSQESRKGNRGGKRSGAGRPRKSLTIEDGRLTPEWERDDWNPEAYSARIKDPMLKPAKPSPREAASRKGVSHKGLLGMGSRNNSPTVTTSFDNQEDPAQVASTSSVEKLRDAEGYILLPDGRRDGRSMRRKRPLEQHDANQSLKDKRSSFGPVTSKHDQAPQADMGDTIELQGHQPDAGPSERVHANGDRHASLMAKLFPKGFSTKAMPT